MPIPDFAPLLRELPERYDLPEESPIDTRILGAALQVVADCGERRLTIDDVADAARVARSTVFRRFGSKDALLRRLYDREVRLAVTGMFAAAADATDARSAMAAGFCQLADHAAAHPVIQRICRVEPDIMAELWRAGDPCGLTLMTASLVALGDGRDPTEMDEASAKIVADTLARLLFAHLLLPTGTAMDLSGPDRGGLVDALISGILGARAHA
jgi:AcrR family transcriptional regulator